MWRVLLRVLPPLVLSLCIVYAAHGTSHASPYAASPDTSLLGWERESGRRQLTALRESYPNIITNMRYIDRDWAVRVRERWFYWAHARMLPFDARVDYQEYASIRFYNYAPGPVKLRALTAAQERRIRALLSDDASPIRMAQHNAFRNTLYDIHDQQSADRKMVRFSFLNHRTIVHPFLRIPLRRVERRIMRQAASDEVVRAFVNGIHSASGYVWRNIQGSTARSYHSYGMAIDILHNEYRNTHVYWRWSLQQGFEEWWNIPIEKRWVPPQAIIDIFESEGFIWGGKWLFFDSVHFEYRPEIIALNRQ